jgi:hypothetical protein
LGVPLLSLSSAGVVLDFLLGGEEGAAEGGEEGWAAGAVAAAAEEEASFSSSKSRSSSSWRAAEADMISLLDLEPVRACKYLCVRGVCVVLARHSYHLSS